MRILHGPFRAAAPLIRHAVSVRLTLRRVNITLQILERLVKLKVARGLVKGFVHRLVELLLLHLNHRLDVFQLHEEQHKERKPHHYRY